MATAKREGSLTHQPTHPPKPPTAPLLLLQVPDPTRRQPPQPHHLPPSLPHALHRHPRQGPSPTHPPTHPFTHPPTHPPTHLSPGETKRPHLRGQVGPHQQPSSHPPTHPPTHPSPQEKQKGPIFVAKWDPTGRRLLTGSESGYLVVIQGTPIKTWMVSRVGGWVGGWVGG